MIKKVLNSNDETVKENYLNIYINFEGGVVYKVNWWSQVVAIQRELFFSSTNNCVILS